jgi:hypothetical protein
MVTSRESGETIRLGWFVLQVFVGTTLLLGGLCLFAVIRYGSIPASLTLLRGSVFYVESVMPSDSLGGHVRGKQQSFRIRNLTSRPIRILGVRPSCNCLAIDDSPRKIAAFGNALFQFVVLEGEGASGQVFLYTDLPEHPTIVLSAKR